MKAIINRDSNFGIIGGVIRANSHILTIINNFQKLGAAIKLVDTVDTLMYKLLPIASGEVVTNGCKLFVQSIKEPIIVYEMEDGELYFSPYGEEELVESYFSNDLILIK